MNWRTKGLSTIIRTWNGWRTRWLNRDRPSCCTRSRRHRPSTSRTRRSHPISWWWYVVTEFLPSSLFAKELAKYHLQQFTFQPFFRMKSLRKLHYLKIIMHKKLHRNARLHLPVTCPMCRPWSARCTRWCWRCSTRCPTWPVSWRTSAWYFNAL